MKDKIILQFNYTILILLSVFFISFTSCISTKKVVYFNDLPDSSTSPIILKNTTRFIDPTIEPNDILAINIQTSDQNVSTSMGSGGGNGGAGGSGGGNGGTNGTVGSPTGSNNPLTDKLVDKNGNIELFLIGFVKVGGYTTSEVREIIKQKAREYYRDPVVNVSISNFQITLLGNIGSPGIVTAPSEKISILDAVALSKDIPLIGKHTNVLLIRSEKDDEKKFVRFDLTSANIFRSPYFYLKQRDILYVEPTKYNIQTSDNTFLRDIGILTTVVSLFSLIYVYSKVH